MLDQTSELDVVAFIYDTGVDHMLPKDKHVSSITSVASACSSCTTEVELSSQCNTYSDCTILRQTAC